MNDQHKQDVGSDSTNINKDVGSSLALKKQKKEVCSQKNFLPTSEKNFIFEEQEEHYVVKLPKNDGGGIDLAQINVLKDSIVDYFKQNSVKMCLKLCKELQPTYKAELMDVLGFEKYNFNMIYQELERYGFIRSTPLTSGELKLKKEALRLDRIPVSRVCFIELNPNKTIAHNNSNISLLELVDKIILPTTTKDNLEGRRKWLNELYREYRFKQREDERKAKEKQLRSVHPLELVKKHIRDNNLHNQRVDRLSLKKIYFKLIGKYMSKNKLDFYLSLLREDGYVTNDNAKGNPIFRNPELKME